MSAANASSSAPPVYTSPADVNAVTAEFTDLYYELSQNKDVLLLADNDAGRRDAVEDCVATIVSSSGFLFLSRLSFY